MRFAPILDGGLQRERALVVDALELHQVQHPRIGEDDLGDHRPECGGLGLPALDRKLVALAAADAPDAVRDPRHLLRRVARTSRPWLRCPCA